MKYSLLTLDELVINLDRLSRFKLPEEAFERVFSDIILKHLIQPKYSKEEFLHEDASVIVSIIEEIWNASAAQACGSAGSSACYNILKTEINSTFKNIDERTSLFINADLNIEPVLKKIDYDKAPLNLKFLIKSCSAADAVPLNELREQFSLCFPVSKLLIVEGITEEILLPVFAEKLNKNFNKNGIFILGAGGKSKSPALYAKLKDRLKIPVIMLFDKDAEEICADLENNLLKKDKYILIQNGEFEDILPIRLIEKTLNSEYPLSAPVKTEDLKIYDKMRLNLENFYRTRRLGGFKKAEFAKAAAENIEDEADISEGIKEIISNII